MFGGVTCRCAERQIRFILQLLSVRRIDSACRLSSHDSHQSLALSKGAEVRLDGETQFQRTTIAPVEL